MFENDIDKELDPKKISFVMTRKEKQELLEKGEEAKEAQTKR